jgi:uncharacterized protein YbjT (DUF2867 family)
MQRVLVIGATGLLGQPVARGLAAFGFTVRVMSRNAGRARAMFPEAIEVVAGDALRLADLEAALAGCNAVHVSIDHDREDECVAQVVEASRTRGVQRISYVSGLTVCEEHRWFPLVNRKLRAEESIVSGGIGYTIFCPGWFMDMLAHFVRDGRALLLGKPSRRWHFVAAEEFARMIVESYRRPDAVNKRFYIHGPQALTVEEALRSYCKVLHPEIRGLTRMPYWLLLMTACIRRSAEMKAGIDIVSYLEKVGERGDPTEANAILGPPQVTLEQWLQGRRAAAAASR